MMFSLNEIEAMGKRAARGTGLAWGLAEEAGKAARWLSACQLPGADMLLHVLTLNDGREYEELAPLSTEGVWEAASGTLCPLIAGPALADLAADIAKGREVQLGQISSPLMLAPYLASLAAQKDCAVKLSWSGAEIIITKEGLTIAGEAVLVPLAENVLCSRTDDQKPAILARMTGCDIESEIWDQLAYLMTRYLAPDTEESRLAGAGGAEITDND